MSTSLRGRATNAGFSLIELMVSMVIALVLTLVISQVMIDHEGTKRSTTTLNDANQNGALAAYELDRAIRSAGSGFTQGGLSMVSNPLGCRINVSLNNSPILPRPKPFPAPFADVSATARLAPVLIDQGADSDVLTVMSGTAGFAEVGRAVSAVTASTIELANTLGWQQDDMLLLSGSGDDCLMAQVGAVSPGASTQLPLAGPYFAATSGSANLTAYASSFAIAMGNISTEITRNNPPELKLFGVDPVRHTLVTYDMLTQALDATPIPLADGVIAFRALYGIDTNLDGVQDSWQEPTGLYASTALRQAGSQARLQQIVSIRIGLIVRTSLLERKQLHANGTKIDLFKDIEKTVSHELTGDDLYARHRTVEVTIPLRNVLLAYTQ
jgi:type IV pilus assembly protein PilW